MPFLDSKNYKRSFILIFKGCTFLCVSFFLLKACSNKTESKIKELNKQMSLENLNALMQSWHSAAANADSAVYFGAMTKNARFLGTDASENWSKDEFIAFAMPHFNKGNGWDFEAYDRNWYFNQDSTIAWFDERLDTWMGECRGSGVIKIENKNAKIAHYNLAVTIANDKIQNFILLTKDSI